MHYQTFRQEILRWYQKHGRNDLPWRHTRDPYRILVSEIMLQQTQVSRVLQKYPAFIRAFPTIQTLAASPLSRILASWQGLGYNRRASYLKRTAEMVMRDCGGELPRDSETLCCFPGIGQSTAGALGAFAWNTPAVFIETNIRRVFLHFFFPRQKRVSDKKIASLITNTLPRNNTREWYYALMDYGAIALREIKNPNRRSAHYTRQSAFHGSERELRGRIIAELIRQREATVHDLQKRLSETGENKNRAQFKKVLLALAADGLITIGKRHVAIAE